MYNVLLTVYPYVLYHYFCLLQHQLLKLLLFVGFLIDYAYYAAVFYCCYDKMPNVQQEEYCCRHRGQSKIALKQTKDHFGNFT